MAMKTAKNLISARDQYNAYYGNFRGVDLASDITEVDNSRFSYAVNVYRDYQSGQGTAVETIPGFRRRRTFADGDDGDKKIHGIYPFDPDLSGEEPAKILLHRGAKLLLLTPEGDGYNLTEIGDMTDGESTSFKVGKYIYVLCKEHYWKIDMESEENKVNKVDIFASPDSAYIPTIISGGERYEQGNMLASKVKEAFVPDGSGTDVEGNRQKFYISTPLNLDNLDLDNLDEIEVTYYGTTYPVKSTDEGGDEMHFVAVYDTDNEKIIGVTFGYSSPSNKLPEENGYPEGYAALVVTYPSPSGFKQSDGTVVNPIKGCTKSCVFDNRVFVSGNPDYPNYVFWCGFNASTGLMEPTYFGELNFDTLGQSNEAIAALQPISNVLGVFKRSAEQDGAVYYLVPQLTEQNVMAKAYSQERGLNGVECLGAAVNFLDDPVFISPLGLEGVGTLSVRYERAIEHRSSLIDPVLTKCDLSAARLVVWQGWLFILCDGGKAFLADSRQLYTHPLTKTMQYEWYPLEGIGQYVDQTQTTDSEGTVTDPEYKGGAFSPACAVAVVDDNVYFGTEHGDLFSFNFDKRTEYGDFAHTDYNFDGRRYISGVATKMDNGGVPHLTKSTVKKSVICKFRSMPHSAARIKVRTNKSQYRDIARVNSAFFTFDDVDFGDFTFSPTNTPLTVIPEKEKKWIEKQYYVFSDEFERPFSLVYLAYRYVIAGRYKE